MTDDTRTGWRGWGIAVTVVIVVLCLAGPIVLHFGQKRHNRLAWDVQAQLPFNKQITGGEAFASTVMAIMEHELNGVTGWRPNDFVLWGPQLWADNNANRQLGILQAV